MKTLNPDILEEVLPHFSYLHPDNNNLEENVENLKKFMSSGKEPFYAALRYFSHTTEVRVGLLSVCVRVKRFPFKLEDGATNFHHIPYDFEYLDAILNAFPKTLDLRINHYPESVEGKRAVAILIHFKKFKSLRIHTQDLPREYIQFFKTQCVFDTIIIRDCYGYNPSLLDFLEMDAQHYIIESTLPALIRESHNLPHLQTFSSVKNLKLNCCQSFNNFIFTMNKIKQLLLIFTYRFPNLQTLNIDYTQFDDDGDYYWDDAYGEMLKMQPQEFRSCVSLQLKGSISFCVFDNDAFFDDFVSEMEEIPGVKVIDNSNGYGKIVKEFEIHDGLTFKVELESSADMKYG